MRDFPKKLRDSPQMPPYVSLALSTIQLRGFLTCMVWKNNDSSFQVSPLQTAFYQYFKITSRQCHFHIENPIGLTWEHDILVLNPTPCLHKGVKYMTGWVSTMGTVGSHLKPESQTGAKILWN
ncbi:hypothetical protein TNCV_2698721 [Trichonephila clavipes]|nr:hypothetical protein TNCV_2698721 [Trichonephila clavipes]